jgi:hypothetical protein
MRDTFPSAEQCLRYGRQRYGPIGCIVLGASDMNHVSLDIGPFLADTFILPESGPEDKQQRLGQHDWLSDALELK